MPRSGGIYTLPPGINPVVLGTLITSNWANVTLSDIATALTNSIAKDGQTIPTANLPMGGFRHTGVGAPSARDQYASLGFIQDGSHVRLTGVAVIGAAITGTLIGGDASYTVGQMFQFILPSSPIANPTLSVNGGPALGLRTSAGTTLPSGVLQVDFPYLVIYNGTNFTIVSGAGEYVKKAGDTMSGDLSILTGGSATLYIGTITANGGITNYGASGVGNLGFFSNVAGGTLRIRPEGRGSQVGEVFFTGTISNFGSDVFVNKSNASVTVGISSLVSGGITNYGLPGVGDIGLYSDVAAGTVRIRPDGRNSVTGEALFNSTSANFLAPTVTIGTQSVGNTGTLRLEDPSAARIGFTNVNRRWTAGNLVSSNNFTIKDESANAGAGVERLTLNSRLGYNLPTGLTAAGIFHGFQLGGARSDLLLETDATDSDGALIAGVWGRCETQNTASAEKRIAGVSMTLDGVTANNRGGMLTLSTKADGNPSMTSRWRVRQTGHIEPVGTDTLDIGTGALRVRQYYGTQTTINTSDARLKTDVQRLSHPELQAAREMAQEIGSYQWLKSVEEKGAGARLHVGFTVQRAMEIMKYHGLDPFRYGFICHDEWPERTEPAEMESVMVKPAVMGLREVAPEVWEDYIAEPPVWHEEILRAAVNEEFPVTELRDSEGNVIRPEGTVTYEVTPAIVDRVLISPAKMGRRKVRDAVMAEVEIEPAVFEDQVMVPEKVIPGGDVYSFRYENLALFLIAGMCQGD